MVDKKYLIKGFGSSELDVEGVVEIGKVVQIDITQPEHTVEVQYNHITKVLHVNVEGICVLRICKISDIEFHEIK